MPGGFQTKVLRFGQRAKSAFGCRDTEFIVVITATLLSVAWLPSLPSFGESSSKSQRIFATRIRSTPEAVGVAKILRKYCIRCHHPTGRVDEHATVGPVEPNLSVSTTELAREREFVSPGQPDASLLYNVMLTRHMPPAQKSKKGFQSNRDKVKTEPTPEEIEQVRDWIERLPEATNCQRPVQSNLTQAIARWLRSLPPKKRVYIRFLSIAHLGPSCSGDGELSDYRNALKRLLNSLNWRPDPVTLQHVDTEGLVLALDLTELHWTEKTWRWLSESLNVRTGLSAHDVSGGDYRNVQNYTRTRVPVIAGDWFAAKVRDPSIYNKLLDLPQSVADFEQRLGLKMAAPQLSLFARQMADLTKGQAQLITRAQGKHGFVWQSYDFAGDRRKASEYESADELLKELATDAKKPADERRWARHTLFQLPNGFIAAASSVPRKDDGSTITNNGFVHPHGYVAGGLDCLGCHNSPIIGLKSNRKAQFESKQKKRKAKDKISTPKYTSTVSPAHLHMVIENDRYAFERTLKRARIAKMASKNGRHYALHALANSYGSAIDLDRAAAETGLSNEDVRHRLIDYNGPLEAIAHRLRVASVSRKEFDLLAAELSFSDPGSLNLAPIFLDRFALKSEILEEANRNILRAGLSLWTTPNQHKKGEPITIHVEAHRNCNVTIINVDQNQQATVLFPNAFEQKNLLERGVRLSVPGPNAKYLLKLTEEGKETIVAICTPVDVSAPPGITHQFTTDSFTILGNWKNHLSNVIRAQNGNASAMKALLRGANKKSRERRNSLRNRLSKNLKLVTQARTSITINIE